MKATKKELFYNEISDNWEKVINNNETQKRLDIIFNVLLKNIEIKNKKVLEVGCGLGYFSKEIGEKGGLVYGVDVGDKLVAISKSKVPKGTFEVASALDLPYKDGLFDIVLCTEVVEHTESPKKVFEELARVVKKGGYVILTTPNKLFKPLFDLLSYLKIRPYNGNENWITISEARKYFENNNCQIMKEVNFNFFYPTPLLNYFEKFSFLKYLMINHGYLVRKI